MANNNPFNVRAGDIWEEIDWRFHRRIKVLDVGKEYAKIITIGVKYGVHPQNARLTRFNGKHHNYRLVKKARRKKEGGDASKNT